MCLLVILLPNNYLQRTSLSAKPSSPPHHYKSKRAWVIFSTPPDLTKGVVVFWETSKNVTIVAGQFSSGFVEGEENEYTFKVYKDTEEIVDLKPSEESFDRLLKIRDDGSTDLFLFTIEDKLISGKDGIVDLTLVLKLGEGAAE
ncbi:3612_t:CDS:2 [Acaulospora colombiana]|uniref:3612_t:CDS:1 n=1 Tax=Acaulospora colombiana TaxID=27376 RepID=A0ACA9K0Y8_9GLOM|nr:3612_t:CDS:2 [Acaulospora colombiana]